MKRLAQRKNWIAALIFIVLVVAGGIALQASGNMENPFTVFTSQSQESREGFTPGVAAQNNDSGSTTTAAVPPANMERGSESGTVNLSQFGHVLFNLWFLFASAAFVMLIVQPIQQIRRRLRPVPAVRIRPT